MSSLQRMLFGLIGSLLLLLGWLKAAERFDPVGVTRRMSGMDAGPQGR
jgi:hypothetical protein